MLLAADDHNGHPDEAGKGTLRIEVLDAGDAPIGTKISVEGFEPTDDLKPEIDIDTFFSIPIKVINNTVTAGGKTLLLEGKPVKTKIISSGEVH